MFYRNNDSKHTTVTIVSLAAGLALAAAAVVGGSDLLKEGNSKGTSPVTPRVEQVAAQYPSPFGPVFAEEDATDYSLPTTFAADLESRPSSSAIQGLENARGFAQIISGQSFATQVDAVYAMEGMMADVDKVPNAAIDARDQALGIGQPGQGSSSVAQYPAESQLDYSLPTTFAADRLPGIGQPAVGQSFATATDAVFATESMLTGQTLSPANLNEYLGVGQPGETSSGHQQFGTMADADFASR